MTRRIKHDRWCYRRILRGNGVLDLLAFYVPREHHSLLSPVPVTGKPPSENAVRGSTRPRGHDTSFVLCKIYHASSQDATLRPHQAGLRQRP